MNTMAGEASMPRLSLFSTNESCLAWTGTLTSAVRAQKLSPREHSPCLKEAAEPQTELIAIRFSLSDRGGWRMLAIGRRIAVSWLRSVLLPQQRLPGIVSSHKCEMVSDHLPHALRP